MSYYIVEGGYPIQGDFFVSGNKNAALPCLAAALLCEEDVLLHNIPTIEDVEVMITIMRTLGSFVEHDPHKKTVLIKAKTLTESQIPPQLSQKIRASILLVPPLLHRIGRVSLPPPGGDVIGRRRLDTHFLALQRLSVHIQGAENFEFIVKKLQGNHIFLDECSVTATENAIMAAVCAQGSTRIENAASEPHVQDLCNLLIAMGAQISGIGSNILNIEGVEKLHGTEFSIGADYMEIGSMIGLAASSGGALRIHNVQHQFLHMMRIVFQKLGVEWIEEGESIFLPSGQKLTIIPDWGNMIPKIDDAPWPGFPPDLTSIATVVATQARGTVLIHEKMFESRMFFVDKLIAMGARIVLCDPHRALVSGPTKLKASELVSPDVRAGMALLIAALCAEGKSTIHNIYQIERGYDSIHERLKAVGAHIEKEANSKE